MTTKRNPYVGGKPLAPALRRTLAALVRRDGEAAVAARVGISRHATARAAGGMGVRPGTIALIEQTLGRDGEAVEEPQP